MGFDEAVNYVNGMALPNGLLWLSLPINAIVSIRRKRMLHPGSMPWLAGGVLILWLGQIGALIYAFGSGTWYGENGPSPQVAAAQITMLSASLVAIHAVLLTSARPSLEIPLRQGWLSRHSALGLALAAGLSGAALYVWSLARQEQLRREAFAERVLAPKIVQVPPPVVIGVSPLQPLQTQQFLPNQQAAIQGQLISPSRQPFQGQNMSPPRRPAHSDAQTPPE